MSAVVEHRHQAVLVLSLKIFNSVDVLHFPALGQLGVGGLFDVHLVVVTLAEEEKKVLIRIEVFDELVVGPGLVEGQTLIGLQKILQGPELVFVHQLVLKEVVDEGAPGFEDKALCRPVPEDDNNSEQ